MFYWGSISGGGQGLHGHLPLPVPTKFDEATTDHVAVSAQARMGLPGAAT
jgi:hypothetical protein